MALSRARHRFTTVRRCSTITFDDSWRWAAVSLLCPRLSVPFNRWCHSLLIKTFGWFAQYRHSSIIAHPKKYSIDNGSEMRWNEVEYNSIRQQSTTCIIFLKFVFVWDTSHLNSQVNFTIRKQSLSCTWFSSQKNLNGNRGSKTASSDEICNSHECRGWAQLNIDWK